MVDKSLNLDNELFQLELKQYNKNAFNTDYDLDRIIFDLDDQINLLSSQADSIDYLLSIGSGVLCSMLDILWVGEFSLDRGRGIASDAVDGFVTKTAKLLGCDKDDLASSVRFLEKKFPIPSDGNTPDFGGGLQHHLRDFAHHPTVVGLIFSLLTQFTCKSYGTDVNGSFKVVDVPEISKAFIGEDVPTKIIYGTITWFFHLVSDVAGSNSSVGKSGGTGLPGPIISFAKELSVLPLFKEINVGDNSISVFLSKMFNGTLFLKRDASGAIVKESVYKFDLRGELGVAVELGRQVIPVVANECIVRSFYFIRRLAAEIKSNNIRTFRELTVIDWDDIKPYDNPTISKMMLIATGIFTSIDIGEAIISQKYWVSINYIGVGRFAVAIGEDATWTLRARDVKRIRVMYEDIKRQAYTKSDENIYTRIGDDMEMNKLGLTIEQIEILYNIEYHKTMNDIQLTKIAINNEAIKSLKEKWLREWKEYMSNGFSSFLQLEEAELHWYTEEELKLKIKENKPDETWFRLVLLEAMLFSPYYPLGVEKDKKGNDIPSKVYKSLQNPINGFKRNEGDEFVDSYCVGDFENSGYIDRLRKCYNKSLRELNEVQKTIIKTLSISAVVTIVTVATAGVLAPYIAVALVGTNFAGLSGAALTSACLAYIGGGAVAVGGAGMAGGTIAIVGGGAILGMGVGAGIGGTTGILGLAGKHNTILQSAKLLVSVNEIFLNDEHDTDYSNSVLEKYVQNIMDIEKGIAELKLKADVASDKEKKELNSKIKDAEESVKAMRIARANMSRFISSYEIGLDNG